MLGALIFDVDGTLADTEEAHRQAFNHAFAEVGRDWSWDTEKYTELLETSGGKERILRYWKEKEPGLVDVGNNALKETIDQMHEIKTAAYENAVKGGAVQLRPGVLRLIESAYNCGLPMAITTTTSPVNIGALLNAAIGPDWSMYFVVIEDASTAPKKKPHPQVYQHTLQRLGIHPRNCLAFEDSSNGLKSATAAGLATVVTQNNFTSHHDFTGALRVLPDLRNITLGDLRDWHAAHLKSPERRA
jgi:beta-phosphoglucomutase-like phosphatase (HAD superfamily)